MRTETATLAGGCYWCLEAAYEALQGVQAVVSGFTGGDRSVTSYRQVCEGESGHAEVVQVTYDADVISFDDLLAVFFTIHDPTTLNRQGNDVGTQYRSAIFCHSPEQKADAEAAIAAIAAEGIWNQPVVTEVVPETTFYVAEDYHQEYFARTGSANPYCSVVVAPKVAKFRKKFLDQLKR